MTNRRPSKLSPIFRRHSHGRLHDWTRHVDGDWRWYCPYCSALVIVMEEKGESAAEQGWSATRRQALRHEDRPYAWKVICRHDGLFTVTIARLSPDGRHESDHRVGISEETLIGWIEEAFRHHYEDAAHPAHLIPSKAEVT